MTVLSNSYGTAAGVAGYTPLFLNSSKAYDTTTSPTLATVEAWINQLSGVANAALSSAEFAVPISQPDCVLMLVGQVEQAVADLCLYSRSSGRFFSEKINANLSVMAQLRKDIYDWVADNATGMEKMGAARETTGGTKTLKAGVIALDFVEHEDDLVY